MKRRKLSNRTVTGGVAMLIGLCIEILMVFVTLFILVLLIDTEYVPLSICRYISPIVYCLSVLVGTVLLGKVSGNEKIRLALIGGSIFVAIQICSGMLMLDKITIALFIHAASSVVGLLAGMYLTNRMNYNRKR